jgi:hypothetical protein
MILLTPEIFDLILCDGPQPTTKTAVLVRLKLVNRTSGFCKNVLHHVSSVARLQLAFVAPMKNQRSKQLDKLVPSERIIFSQPHDQTGAFTGCRIVKHASYLSEMNHRHDKKWVWWAAQRQIV